MNKLTELLQSVSHFRFIRIVLYGLLAIAVTVSLWAQQEVKTRQSTIAGDEAESSGQHDLFLGAVKKLKELSDKTTTYKAGGVAVETIEAKIIEIKTQIFQTGDYAGATTAIEAAMAQLEELRNQKLASDEAARLALEMQGTLTGTVTEGSTALSGVSVSVASGSTTVAKTTSDSVGKYSLNAAAGSYTVVASRSGYTTLRQYNVVITAKSTTTANLSLTKAPATTTSSGSASTANSTYERKTIVTSRGSFLADVIALNLASGGIKVHTDTASDNDCTDNCPAKSLSSYIGGLGGFAGINGTYFCPPDYASCAGQTNSFYWKIKNSRIGKMINANNGLGVGDPFLTFSSSGPGTYYSTWGSASQSVFSGINSKPRLVQGGAIVLQDSDMDDKQRYTKSNRGGLGLKGQTLYAVIAKSATVPDLAAVMQALGVDTALNIDGGGSSAMYYNGSYKVGPGRSLPNAVIFAGG